MIKEIDGPITQPLDWNNFPLEPPANCAPFISQSAGVADSDPASYVDPSIGNISITGPDLPDLPPAESDDPNASDT